MLHKCLETLIVVAKGDHLLSFNFSPLIFNEEVKIFYAGYLHNIYIQGTKLSIKTQIPNIIDIL